MLNSPINHLGFDQPGEIRCLTRHRHGDVQLYGAGVAVVTDPYERLLSATASEDRSTRFQHTVPRWEQFHDARDSTDAVFDVSGQSRSIRFIHRFSHFLRRYE